MSYGGNSYSSVATNTALAWPSQSLLDQLFNGVTNLRGGYGALYVNSSGNDYFNGSNGTGNLSYCGNGTNSSNYKISCYDAVFDNIFTSPYIIGVAALDANNIKAQYSTPGASIWISAYGGDFGYNTNYAAGGTYPYTNGEVAVPNMPAITTTDRSTCTNKSSNNEFVDSVNPHSDNPNCNYTNTMNGTSSAAPMVSGVIALMLEANNDLYWKDIKHILASTAVKVDSNFSADSINGIDYVGWISNQAGFNFHPWYGFGAIDASAAVSEALAWGTQGKVLPSSTLSAWNSSAQGSVSLGEGLESTFSLIESGEGIVEHVLVALAIEHSEPNHLGFRLESPDGTISTLLTPLTAIGTDFSSSTFIYLPSNAFYGESKLGEWKLHTYDHLTGNTGSIAQWAIQFTYRN